MDESKRIEGCAVGAAVGDALGMPLEFGPIIPPDRLLRVMKGNNRLPAGSFTDDTEMALALADSLMAVGHVDGADLAAHFLSWYQTGPSDVGLQTSSILSWLARGSTWEEASLRMEREKPGSAGNGSVMRCWPVALVYWRDPQHLAEESILQSRVTHPNPDCTAACVFTNRVIAALIGGMSRADAVSIELAAIPMSGQLREAIQQAPGKQRGQLKNSGWAVHTVESAVWGLLTTNSFEEAVVQVANLGNDADTAASVTGALAGAAYGLDAVPSEWRQGLRGEWPVNSKTILHEVDFIELAHRLDGLLTPKG
jgi:ADP-ribosyl-[dinitrogen reductase] hydrolase